MYEILSGRETCWRILHFGLGPIRSPGASVTGSVGGGLFLQDREADQTHVQRSSRQRQGVKVRYFTAKESELFERLKAEGLNTPADLFMTVDAGNLWRAEQAGLLQGFKSKVIAKNIPAHLRARDNSWVGLSIRARPIMYSTKRVQTSQLSTYAALGDPRWKGRLCLRTSRKVYTLSLVATMIKSLGEKRAEEVARGWIANKPRIFNSDTRLIKAMGCGAM